MSSEKNTYDKVYFKITTFINYYIKNKYIRIALAFKTNIQTLLSLNPGMNCNSVYNSSFIQTYLTEL